jgi:hypothetical protein
MSEKLLRIIWFIQGIVCAILIITFLSVDFLFIKALEKSGNLEFALKYFIEKHWLGYLMLLVVLIGSFLKWRVSIIVNILYLYFTMTSIIATLELSSGNAHFQYLTVLSNISLVMLVIMHLCGFMLLLHFIRQNFHK